MSAVRSNRVALLAAAVCFTIFMGLVHFYLSTPATATTPATQISNSVLVVDKKPAPTTHAADEALKVATNTINDVVASPTNDPVDPDEITFEVDVENVNGPTHTLNDPGPTNKPDEPVPPTRETANVDAFRPEQWVFPAVKPTDPEYAQYGHWPAKLPADQPYWTESLGKRLCIVDLESRSFDKPGELWSESMTWNRSSEVHGPSGGTLNHWAYAKIHGYQYYYVKINTYPDRRDSWKKPSVLSKILKHHDVCVFIDSDAMFNHLSLPLEWLMNYWSLNPVNNSLALPVDPDTQHNRDRFNNLFLNTGFMIMQNNTKLYEMFKDWDDCPNEGGKYPGCTEFRNRKGWQPTDQGGFGTFIRYDYKDHIKELPCTEANGFPESNSGCNGEFIKHVWLGKEDRLVLAVGAVFPGVLLETFHKQFINEKDTFFTTEDKIMAGDSIL